MKKIAQPYSKSTQIRPAFAAMSRDERDTFLVILQISLFEQQNLIFDNSNALTGDQETFGGGSTLR